ncbi:hypothetical protein SAMD00019534_059310, partial [Acytostelium subglobosum LB1]|uniref:hypothetical protein n=1 Tax=Acytostelium subglobosum LB1 TaxID=1410327 RepID=UPI000644ECC3
MDINVRRKLADLINEATKTGALELSKEHATSLKSIVKQSNLYVKCAHDMCIEKLTSKHCQVRLSALNIINELFMRSKYFRELLCEHLTLVFENAVGTDAAKPLPQPAQTALYMRPKALEYVERWCEAYGDHYIHLRVGYHYLKDSLKIQFPDARTAQTQRNVEEEERRNKTQNLLRHKYNQLRLEFGGIVANIETNLDDMDKLFGQLVPSEKNFDDLFKEAFDDEGGDGVDGGGSQQDDAGTRSQEEPEQDIVRRGGFGNLGYEIEVTIDKDAAENILTDNKDNVDKVVAKKISVGLAELERVQLLVINDWYTTLVKIDISAHSDTEYSNYMRKVIEIQTRLNNIKGRSNDDNNNNNNSNNNNDPTSYLDDDGNELEMVEVNGEEYEDESLDHLDPDDPSSTTTTTTTTTTSTSSPTKFHKLYFGSDVKPQSTDDLPEEESIEDMLKRAPVVAAHASLMHWGKTEVSLHKGIEVEHRFMGASNVDPVVPISTFVALNQMTTVYEAPPLVVRECRHPLKKGGLCPRKHVKDCPYHGKIVDRDDNGYPIDELDQDEQLQLAVQNSLKTAPKPEKKRKTSGLEPLNHDPVQDRLDQLILIKKK